VWRAAHLSQPCADRSRNVPQVAPIMLYFTSYSEHVSYNPSDSTNQAAMRGQIDSGQHNN